MSTEYIRPADIEQRSMELIARELPHPLDPLHADIIMRVIHASADFDFSDSLCFSPNAVANAVNALQSGCRIITDTQMARAGINKKTLAALGGSSCCFVADEDIAQTARQNGITRSAASMDKAAATLQGPTIFAIGNAPTALIRLCELIDEGKLSPVLVIGAPVGFVNVVESKERLLRTRVPSIVARGRKGGSTIAAAILNALLYQTGARVL